MAARSQEFGNDDDELLDTFIVAMQGAWWAAALDEQSRRFEGQREAYRTRRDLDDFGKTVNGLTWIRDRSSHQLAFPLGRDETKFLPGPPFYLTADGFVWMRRDELPAGDRAHDTNANHQHDHYDAQVGGQGVAGTLARAAEWFERERSVPGSLLFEAARFMPGRPEHHRISQRDH